MIKVVIDFSISNFFINKNFQGRKSVREKKYVPSFANSAFSKKLKYCGNYLNCLQFPNSSKNGFRGNYLYEEMRHIFLKIRLSIFSPICLL